MDAPQSSQDLAARLREAAAGIDPDALADRAAALREGREADWATRRLFTYSILYLFALFAVLLAEHVATRLLA